MPFAPDDVTIHRIDLRVRKAERRELEALLSPDERARAEQLGDGRERYVVAHARLRMILADYDVGEPEALCFGAGARGKPMLLSDQDLRFNLSHAGDVALVAVSWRREVGVDVERIEADRVPSGVARRFFSVAENAALARLSEPAQALARLRCWCRKEAYVKARGEGLHLVLDSFDVAVEVPEMPEQSLLFATRPHAGDASAWELRDVEAGAGYVGAVAVEGRIGRLSYVD